MLIFLNSNGQTVELDVADMIVLPELEHANIQRSEDDVVDLRNQILKEKVIRDPFMVWIEAETNRPLLVDGFTRRKIVMNSLDDFDSGKVQCHLVRFDSMEEAIAWININQNNRRNLTPEQKSYMIGNLYNSYKNNKAGLMSFLSVQGIEMEIDDAGLENRSSAILGDFFKFDEKTVRRYGHFATGIEKLKSKGDLSGDLVYQYLSGRLKDENGKHIKLAANVIEKLGQGTIRQPHKLEAPEDFLKLSEKKETVKKKDKVETLKAEIQAVLSTFYKNPTSDLEDSITGKLAAFRKAWEKKQETVEA